MRQPMRYVALPQGMRRIVSFENYVHNFFLTSERRYADLEVLMRQPVPHYEMPIGGVGHLAADNSTF